MGTATREAYGKALAQLVKERKDIIVLDADLSGSTKTAMAKNECPEQFFNMGIAEGNMIGVAAGLATCKKTVFASTFAMFAAGRAYEQIRNSVAYPRLNVKICGTHAGICVGEDGATHQCIEDLNLMRGIPGMTVIQPCDQYETMAAIRAISEINGPCYVRLGRLAVDDVYDESYQFKIGKGNIIRQGKKVAVIATGLMVQQTLKAIDLLNDEDPTVVNMPTIKPIDKDLIIELAKTHDVIITCEEHNIIGGLGSAVSEVLTKYYPCRQVMIGIQDTFGESGTPQELFAKYGVDEKSIAKHIKEEYKRS